ncbi:hypothetical protein AB0L71_29225 [Streptomyces sp. NPDC052052]|uniref:hypothetical protein n=1 Tax=Streptomyces sp. NPDC052052 TaxID=3154756 RepID=UPI003429FD03
MSDTPVPIPPGSAPPGVPAWLSVDTEPWARLRSPSWARPMWSVLALIATVVWAIAVEPVPPCSEAAPCGPEWGSLVQAGLALGLLYWFARLPELALIAAPALAVIVAWGELPGAAWGPKAANSAVIAALAFGWAAARARLCIRRRRRQLAEQAAGTRHLLPEPVGPLVRGTIPIAAGLILVALAAGMVALGVRGIHADGRHADRAEHITGRVIGRGEESVRLRTDEARRLTVDAFYPEDYAIGSTVTVLEDGSWRRLAAEPYDAFDWQLLALAATLPGLSLLAVGVLARRRAAALRSAPVPVLRVLERLDRDGVTVVYAADDDEGRTPLFECYCLSTLPDRDEPDGADDVASDGDSDGSDAYDDEGFPVLDGQLREAVMFGAPYEEGELVFATTGENGDPVVIRTAGAVHLRGTDKDPSPASPGAVNLRDQERGERAAAALKPTEQPMRWGPGVAARVAAAAIAVGVVAGVWGLTRSLITDGFGWDVIPVLGLLMMVDLVAKLLNWRVTADSTGLWLTGAWKVRHAPWERVRAAEYTEDGSVEVRLSGGEICQLTGLGWPSAERRLRIRPTYVRMVEEVTALRDHPELRPTGMARPREHGRPLGPLLLLLAGLGAVAALVA